MMKNPKNEKEFREIILKTEIKGKKVKKKSRKSGYLPETRTEIQTIGEKSHKN